MLVKKKKMSLADRKGLERDELHRIRPTCGGACAIVISQLNCLLLTFSVPWSHPLESSLEASGSQTS